ncbi:VWA domain-containing protein [Candidatus Binatia bacterium]|nr:VWA domain-containing protein [Candidatus Binatia bacterium]
MFALAEPLALLLAGLYGLLVLYHMWERRRRRLVVPSLLLWQAVSEDVIRARRFRPDLLFVVQALALAALILGLARPYRPGLAESEPTGRRIFVLDTSASMQSREGRQTRFESARAAATERLAGLPGDTEVMLLAADNGPRVVVDFTRDRAAVRAALTSLQPVDLGGDLTLTLAFADAVRQRTDLPTAIDVFTDVARASIPATMRDRVTLHQSGETDANLAITGIQVFQGRFQDPAAARATIQVQNFAPDDGHGVLTIELGGTVLNRTGFTLPGRGARSFLFDRLPNAGPLLARLETDDALAVDNAAFAWVAPVRPLHVLLVSDDAALARELRELAGAVSGLVVSTTDPQAFDPARPGDADVVVLHGLAPNPPLDVNALYVFPHADSALFPATAEVEDVEVIDWDDTHPALRGLRPLAAMPLRRGRMVDAPPWMRPIVRSRAAAGEFPLVLAGERDGHRVACITFDLGAEGLLRTDRVNLLLLTINILGWLAPGADETFVVRTGETADLGRFPTDTVTVDGPQGATRTIPGPQVAFEPVLAGAYRVRSDGVSRLVLANFLDPTESDIGRAGRDASSELPAAAPRSTADRRSRPPSVSAAQPWLYAAALVLLVVEWALWTRRPA